MKRESKKTSLKNEQIILWKPYSKILVLALNSTSIRNNTHILHRKGLNEQALYLQSYYKRSYWRRAVSLSTDGAVKQQQRRWRNAECSKTWYCRQDATDDNNYFGEGLSCSDTNVVLLKSVWSSVLQHYLINTCSFPLFPEEQRRKLLSNNSYSVQGSVFL